jgi:hypothetical protein
MCRIGEHVVQRNESIPAADHHLGKRVELIGVQRIGVKKQHLFHFSPEESNRLVLVVGEDLFQVVEVRSPDVTTSVLVSSHDCTLVGGSEDVITVVDSYWCDPIGCEYV